MILQFVFNLLYDDVIKSLRICWKLDDDDDDVFHQQLQKIGSLSIPRKCILSVSEQIELHDFCDESQEAYKGCIYVRSKTQSGQVYAHLLCFKSRVLQIKKAIIPHLELGEALILSQLIAKEVSAWGLEVKNFYLQIDSMVVLGWLNSQSTR